MARQIGDLTEQKFGELIVLGLAEKKNGKVMWKCQCSCGFVKDIRSDSLLSGMTTSCHRKGMHDEDLTGKTFGRLTVLEHVKNNKDNHVLWKCKCSCGNETTVSAYRLLNNLAKGCRCLVGDKSKKAFGEAAFNEVISSYKRHARSAKRKEIKFLMSDEEAKNKMLLECAYCGALPSNVSKNDYNNGDFIYNSLDKIDSNGDYTIDNTNPCCSMCNEFKAKYTINEYFAWAKRIYEYLHLETGFDENRKYIEKNITPSNFNESAFNCKFRDIKQSAKQRKKEFHLIHKDVRNKIFDNCFYCGVQPLNECYSYDKKYMMLVNGIDRRDNNVGYIPENIVPCCDQCNYAKNTYTEEAFCNHVKRVYEHNKLNKYKPDTTLHTHTMKHFRQIKNKQVKKRRAQR